MVWFPWHDKPIKKIFLSPTFRLLNLSYQIKKCDISATIISHYEIFFQINFNLSQSSCTTGVSRSQAAILIYNDFTFRSVLIAVCACANQIRQSAILISDENKPFMYSNSDDFMNIPFRSLMMDRDPSEINQNVRFH